MYDLIEPMTRAAYADLAEENIAPACDQLDPERQVTLRRAMAAALEVALAPLAGSDGLLHGIEPGSAREHLQGAYDKACAFSLVGEMLRSRR